MKLNKPLTYKKSGVDIKKAEKTINLIKKSVFSTFSNAVLNDLSTYAGLFKIETDKFKEPVLVSSTDGVGTKLIIAKEMNYYENIGQDLFAMCLNDILCCGAEPLFFLDYIACGKLMPKKIEIIVNSIAESCKSCNTALIGGEIAEMPDVYGVDDIDLAGFIVGIVERKKIIQPSLVNEGDIVLGLASSGFHSNGFSLIRKIIKDKNLDLKRKYNFKEKSFAGELLGHILLIPTKLYFKILKTYFSEGLKINGIAHITGGGFYGNISRIIPNNLDVVIHKGSWHVFEIFKFIQDIGEVDENEMYKVFNMGIGMVLIIDPAFEKRAIKLSSIVSERVYKIGKVTSGKGRVILI